MKLTARKVTIQDIAREAGVGKTTVSRVINGSGYVKSETEQKIREVMDKYQYQPNAAAQTLSRQESDAVGLLLPEVNNPFFSEMISGISAFIEKSGFTLVLSNSDNDPLRDARALEMMSRQRVRGLIYVPACDYDDEENYGRIKSLLERLSCPIVILDRPIAKLTYDCVTTDNFSGAMDCTNALIEAGHRRIGVVVGNMELFIGRERFRGFKKALESARIPLKEKDVLYGEFSQQTTYQLVKEMLESGDYPRAFFLSNNLSEAGFLQAVTEKGLRIPEDIAFVSFDKISNQEIFNLPFSYLERNIQDLGEQAARLLVRRFNDPDGPQQRVVVMSKVVLLGSEKKIE